VSEPGFPDSGYPVARPELTEPDLAGPDPEQPGPAGFGTTESATAPLAAVEPDVVEAEPASAGSTAHRARSAFRRWRRTRPFWGGFLVVLGGVEITFTEKAPFEVVVHVGLYGLAGYLLPVILILCGLLILFNPQQRTFYSILSVLLALGTWLTSNLGGFVIGMILGIVGGSLAFGWAPGEREPRKTGSGRKQARRSQMHGDPAP
jgi:Family of unknown function (DUF6114)